MSPFLGSRLRTRRDHSERYDQKNEYGVAALPEISRFYGIVVAMFFNDHDPPHFHARYGEQKVIVSIESLELLVGSLPRRAQRLLLEWARMHQDELREDWRRARAQESLLPIDPLE